MHEMTRGAPTDNKDKEMCGCGEGDGDTGCLLVAAPSNDKRPGLGGKTLGSQLRPEPDAV